MVGKREILKHTQNSIPDNQPASSLTALLIQLQTVTLQLLANYHKTAYEEHTNKRHPHCGIFQIPALVWFN
jgi:hypothetical protein